MIACRNILPGGSYQELLGLGKDTHPLDAVEQELSLIAVGERVGVQVAAVDLGGLDGELGAAAGAVEVAEADQPELLARQSEKAAHRPGASGDLGRSPDRL